MHWQKRRCPRSIQAKLPIKDVSCTHAQGTLARADGNGRPMIGGHLEHALPLEPCTAILPGSMRSNASQTHPGSSRRGRTRTSLSGELPEALWQMRLQCVVDAESASPLPLPLPLPLPSAHSIHAHIVCGQHRAYTLCTLPPPVCRVELHTNS